MRGRAAIAMACALTACAGDYAVKIRFPRDVEDVARVEISVVPSCDDIASPGDPPRTTILQMTTESNERPSLGHVDSGKYGLYARAWDHDCRLVAAGCSPIEVEEGGEGTVEAILVSVNGRSCDPGRACLDGLCEITDGGTEERDSAADDSGPRPEPDAGSCIDEDQDGACADRDCDDSDIRRSPDFREFCVDYIDNDCDDLEDFADACDVTNDRCEEPFATLSQADGPRTEWRFAGLPLDSRFGDDYQADSSAKDSDTCEEASGEGGGDAVFKIVVVAPSDLEVTVSAAQGGIPVAYLRSDCVDSPDDICAMGNAAQVTIRARLNAGDERYLFVDEDVPGPVDVSVLLTWVE